MKLSQIRPELFQLDEPENTITFNSFVYSEEYGNVDLYYDGDFVGYVPSHLGAKFVEEFQKCREKLRAKRWLKRPEQQLQFTI